MNIYDFLSYSKPEKIIGPNYQVICITTRTETHRFPSATWWIETTDNLASKIRIFKDYNIGQETLLAEFDIRDIRDISIFHTSKGETKKAFKVFKEFHSKKFKIERQQRIKKIIKETYILLKWFIIRKLNYKLDDTAFSRKYDKLMKELVDRDLLDYSIITGGDELEVIFGEVHKPWK